MITLVVAIPEKDNQNYKMDGKTERKKETKERKKGERARAGKSKRGESERDVLTRARHHGLMFLFTILRKYVYRFPDELTLEA